MPRNKLLEAQLVSLLALLLSAILLIGIVYQAALMVYSLVLGVGCPVFGARREPRCEHRRPLRRMGVTHRKLCEPLSREWAVCIGCNGAPALSQ